MTKVPRDWKTFLSNDENKRRRTGFLLEEWKKDKFAEKLHKRTVIFSSEEDVVCLTSVNDQDTLVATLQKRRPTPS